MDDLISRQAARRIIEDINTFVSGWWYSALEQIDELPTAEKKGKWIVVDRQVVCSECYNANIETNYCPNCGADMRGERNEP